ncbi:MAG: alpha/beta hydrolase fold domain-containing protein, partial [Clostridiales bacterium]|nr:alpha/beta hydrolase fold domain-containing protein [Clostridiales bacterium]
TAVTSINGTVVDTCTLPSSSTSGPLGLRFSNTESGKIDFIKVTQNGSVVFQDDFDFIDSEKWNIPVPAEPVDEGYDINYALNRSAVANSDVNMPNYFRQSYLTDGVVNCANPNFGYSSKGYGSADIASDPSVITVDLGSEYTFNHLVLYPRNDVSTGVAGASSPNFMVDFSVSVSSDGTTFTDAYSIVDNPNPDGKAQGHAFEDVTGRYVRITTTKLGLLPSGENAHYLQFAELEIYRRENLALNKTALANSDVNAPVYFNQAYLTDGIRGCQGETHSGQNGNFGYSSKAYASTDLSADPNIIAVDFGEVKTVNQISLYPRDDITVNGGDGAANFPVTFDVQVSTDGTNFETVYSVEDYACESAEKGYIHSFDDHEARFVRVVTKKVSERPANEPTSYVQVSEFEVYNRPAVDQNPGETIQRNFSNLPYANNSATQLLDIQLPSVGEGPYPVVVFFHGGAWLIGDKTDAESRGILNTALSKGYAVVNVNYRLASEAQWPAQIYDCKAAIRYIRANAEQYNFDPDRIAVLGASAGAHLAQMTGVTNGMASMEDLSMGNAEYSSEVQAVVSLYGISDLTKWDMRESLFGWLGDPNKKLLGDNYTEEEALAASPITYLSENTIPFFIAHGRNDNLVEPEHSYTLEAKLKELIDPELVDTYYPANGPHGDAGFWNTQEPIDNVMAFLQKRFEPHKPLTNGDNFRAFGSLDLRSYPNSAINLQYASNSATQKLHIVTPTTGEGPYPTIVFIHGGGFAGGNSSNGQALYTARGPIQALEKGYAVAFVDYRCGGEAKYPAPVHDIKAAIRYLRANADTYKLDADRFAIWGESAGGHLADFVALTSGDSRYEDLSMGNAEYSSEIQAAVSWYAITNLTTNRNQQYAPTLLGYGASANYDGALDASPIAHVTKDVCPFYIQHGLADNEVEYQDSIQLYNLIVEAAGEDQAKLELFPGINHAVKKFIESKNIDKIIAWLDEKMPAPETDIVFGEDTPSQAYVNEQFPVSITTPGDVQRIRLFNEYGLAIGVRDMAVTDNEDGTRTFTFKMSVGTAGDKRVFTVHTYIDGVETVTRAKMKIDIKTRAPEIYFAAFEKEVGVINGNVAVRVVTDKNTVKVNLYNEYGLRMGVKSRSYMDTDDGRVWTLVTSFGNDGVRTLFAEAQNKHGAKSEKLETSNQVKIVVMLLD